MFRKTPIFLVTLALVATGALAQDAPTDGARMVVPEKVIDVGKVPQGKTANVSFTINNVGDEKLEIHDVRPTCGCTVAEFPKEIAPGTSGEIKAKLDTRDFSGPISKSIMVLTSDPQTSTVTLIVKADVEPYVQIVPSPLMRFNTLQKQGASHTVTVFALDGMKNFKVTKVESSSSSLEASFRQLTGKDLLKGHPEPQYEIQATISDDAPFGALQAEVTIHTNHKQAKSVRVKVFGVIRPVLQLSPAVLQFGTVKASAEPGRHLAVVNNNPEVPITVEGVEIDDPDFSATVETLVEGERFRVTVTVDKDAKAGPKEATLTLTTSDEDFSTLTVPIRAMLR